MLARIIISLILGLGFAGWALWDVNTLSSQPVPIEVNLIFGGVMFAIGSVLGLISILALGPIPKQKRKFSYQDTSQKADTAENDEIHLSYGGER